MKFFILLIIIAFTNSCINVNSGLKTRKIPKYSDHGNPFKDESIPVFHGSNFICKNTITNEELLGWYFNEETYKRVARTKRNSERKEMFIKSQCEGKRIITQYPTNDKYYQIMIYSFISGMVFSGTAIYLIKY